MRNIRSKSAGDAHYLYNQTNDKAKPKISPFKPHWTTGINRRDFIKSGFALSLLAGMSACKPNISSVQTEKTSKLVSNIKTVKLNTPTFNVEQHLDLNAIFMRLFPDDGDGPSANDLNVTTYLEWAMTDERNIADGDPEFIAKGIGWLNQLSNDNIDQKFRDASIQEQEKLLTETIGSDAGRNWISILLYYVVEALTLDPFYGGNTNQVGWDWLQHQGGFPRPIQGKTYRDFS
ncbi:MAG: gluconate 2-dehydrogenase subunit 3 family protein [Proteobacteria bacterium]|nr:gluconate 2-dehydrogenase subunit 3 family protein [Pseudomonadota bacterium]